MTDSATENRTTELLRELRDLACDIHAAEIIDHVHITHRGWTFDSQWLDSWHAEFDRITDKLEQAIAATLGSEPKPCPWCGRDMDKRSEADKDNAGHTWYRDDSAYIQGLIRSNEFMKKERATLGSEREKELETYHGYEQAAIEAWESIKAWNTRATHGKLTAEQVRKAIFNGSSYASYDGAKYYADGINMQAIADELNEALGGGECDAILDESYYKGIHGYCEGLKCSNCGEPLFSEFKSCPWCGKRIRKKVDE